MATCLHVLPFLLILLAQHGDCQVLSLNPPSVDVPINSSSVGSAVSIRCQFSLSTDDMLLFVQIKRTLVKDFPNNDSTVIVATFSGGEVKIKEEILGSTVTGSGKDGFIQLNLGKAKCDDSGTYTCLLNVYREAGDTITKDEKDLLVQVSPGPITLTPTPKGATVSKVNDTLTMLCNAPVGTVFHNTKIQWFWEIRNTAESGLWQPYDGDDSDVTYGSTTPQDCYERRTSTLTRVLELKDSDREYRCYIRHDTIDYVQFAGIHPVGKVNEQGADENTDNNNSAGSPGVSKADVGPIIGGVVGGLLVIIIIIIIVVFLIRRKKSSGGAEDPDKPAETPVPPYTAPVTYSQPNRFRNDRERGETNKAMDDDPPKSNPYEPEPTHYANDFYGGRPNWGYDNNVEPRGPRYSSDDGGPDNRINTSMHSMGYGDPSLGTAI